MIGLIVDNIRHHSRLEKKSRLQVSSFATEKVISAGDFKEKSGRTAKTMSAQSG
jgi:hypothetical protein